MAKKKKRRKTLGSASEIAEQLVEDLQAIEGQARLFAAHVAGVEVVAARSPALADKIDEEAGASHEELLAEMLGALALQTAELAKLLAALFRGLE